MKKPIVLCQSIFKKNVEYLFGLLIESWVRGLMVKALVFGTKDWEFESPRARRVLLVFVRIGHIDC